MRERVEWEIELGLDLPASVSFRFRSQVNAVDSEGFDFKAGTCTTCTGYAVSRIFDEIAWTSMAKTA